MTRDSVLDLCKTIAPEYGFDPLVILSLIQQESSFDQTEARLEQNFYRRYMRPKLYATTTEILFSASYGLGQVMGCSLHEMGRLDAEDEIQVVKNINAYMTDPKEQITSACQWLKFKQSQGTGSVMDALIRYNGSTEYGAEVMKRYKDFKEAYAKDLHPPMGASGTSRLQQH